MIIDDVLVADACKQCGGQESRLQFVQQFGSGDGYMTVTCSRCGFLWEEETVQQAKAVGIDVEAPILAIQWCVVHNVSVRGIRTDDDRIVCWYRWWVDALYPETPPHINPCEIEDRGLVDPHVDD